MGTESQNATPAEKTEASTEAKPKSAAKIRKRAPKACLSCRARKVRCDVSQRGRPCMNCYLDNESCIVTGRASRFKRPQREGAEEEACHPPYAKETVKGRTAEDVVRSRDNGEPPSPRAAAAHIQKASQLAESTTSVPHLPGDATPRAAPTREQQASVSSSASDVMSNAGSARALTSQPPTFREPVSMPLKTMAGSLGAASSESGPFWTGEQRAAANVDITYSYYPFISVNNLHIIMPQDVNYLEAQGCLRVPTRRVLDEFVQQYFLHVHPILPLINEGDFWEMYCHQGTSGPSQRIPLLVLVAMMFASCNFVSQTSIKSLGFASIREARATLYRRTKLLFDFDTESSLIHIAQTAILLSFWSPNWALATKKPNSGWLAIAIQNARSAGAHLQSALPTLSPVHQPVEYKKQNTLKRLWWCCIVRDRILSLGMRRSIQISRAMFDVDTNIGLGYTDLADEIGRSKVYSPDAKRSLIDLLIHLVELCGVLADLLTLVFPADDVAGWGQPSPDAAAKIRECKLALRRWYKGATLRFPMFGGGSVPRLTAGSGRDYQHESVILYTNLMYMYYHSARVQLSHHEVLQSAVATATPNLSSNLREFSNIYENRHELQDAASGVTECLKELIQLGLARWLPISAVACTALPLALHIIDVRLSAANKDKLRPGDPDSQSAVKQHRLNILIEAMKTYQPQYDGVDYVSEAIRHIVNLAQLDPPPGVPGISIKSGQPISDWTDILASRPGFYLRLAMTMDLALSKGRLPEESDFPASLRGLYTGGATHTTNSSTTAQQTESTQLPQTTQSFFTPASSLSMAPGTVQSIPSDEDAHSPSSSRNLFPQHPGTITGLSPSSFNDVNHSHFPSDFSLATMPPTNIDHNGSSAGEGFPMGLFEDVLDNIDNLAGEVLQAYNLNADDGTPPSDAGSDEQGEDDLDLDMYDSDDPSLKEGDWIGQAWTDDYLGNGSGMALAGIGGVEGVGNGDANDQDTAMALLDEVRDDGVRCN